jgi:hypothetical protein
VSIFAREITDNLASLVKQVDEQVGKNEGKKMAAFVVLLSEDPDASAPKLEELAKQHGIKNVPLTIFDGEAGPGNYKIAQDADVTVLMWKGLEVQANHAFKKGELNAASVETVAKDTSKILK